jgi:predicted 3-demethylubiquinone-9 3-methyltransferase (glyoxalase superfamily)
MTSVTPFLWFESQAEEAMNFYVSVFKNSRVISVSRVGEGAPGGSVLSVTFELDGQRFHALNGGPAHAGFTETISFFVDCEDQSDVDDLWEKLTADGGEPGPCGWLKDKYGLSWQIIPKALGAMLSDTDTRRSQRVMEAMLKMSKIDVRALQAAYDAVAV